MVRETSVALDSFMLSQKSDGKLDEFSAFVVLCLIV